MKCDKYRLNANGSRLVYGDWLEVSSKKWIRWHYCWFVWSGLGVKVMCRYWYALKIFWTSRWLARLIICMKTIALATF